MFAGTTSQPPASAPQNTAQPTKQFVKPQGGSKPSLPGTTSFGAQPSKNATSFGSLGTMPEHKNNDMFGTSQQNGQGASFKAMQAPKISSPNLNKPDSTGNQQSSGRQENLGARSAQSIKSQGSIKKEGGVTLKQLDGEKNTYSQYNKNYEKISSYDILNYYYMLIEAPEEFQREGRKLSQFTASLSKLIPGQPARIRPDASFVNYTEFNNIPEPHLKQVKNFWFQVVMDFLREHAYCSFEGIVEMLHFHIKQNKDKYYPNGDANLQLFRRHQVLNDEVNVNNPFFRSIQKALERMLTVFVDQVCALLAVMPARLVDQLLQDEYIVNSLFNAFRAFNKRELVHDCNSNVHEQMGLNIVNVLIAVHHKNEQIFSKKMAIEVLRFAEANISFISHHRNIYQVTSHQRSLEIDITKKLLQLLNLLLLRHPYRHSEELEPNWDDQLIKTIADLKSELLQPFRWLIVERSHEHDHRGRFDPEGDRELTTRNVYGQIVGKEWMLLLRALMQNQRKYGVLRFNEYYKDTIFFLMCSIIEQKCVEFWTESEQFMFIYNYITSIYLELERSEDFSDQYFSTLGKLSRVMLAACGRNELAYNTHQVSDQLLRNFQRDSLMLRSQPDLSSGQPHSLVLSNLVYNHFTSNVINSSHRGVTKQKLFGKVILKYLVKSGQEEDYALYSALQDINDIQARYHYQLPNVINDLLIRMMTDSPALLKALLELWNKENVHFADDDHKNENDSEDYISFLWRFTFQYAISVHDSCIGMMYDHSQAPSSHVPHLEGFQVLPQVLELISKTLSNAQTREIALTLLRDPCVTDNPKLRQTLERSMHFEANLKALTRHVETLYELGLGRQPWVSQVCSPTIDATIETWQITVVTHFANITRIAIVQRCFKGSKDTIAASNILGLRAVENSKPKIEFSEIKIEELSKYSDYLLEFIKWSLRLEEDSLQQQIFYNTLFITRKYQTLQSALKLLEVLVVASIEFRDRVCLNQKMRRFLTLHNPNNASNILSSLTAASNNSAVLPQIELGNKKIATLPSVLAYLIAAPILISASQLKEHDSPKAREIRSIALNVFNILVADASQASNLQANLKEGSTEVLRVDPLSHVDLNIYETYFIGDFQKIYCSAQQHLIDYIYKQIVQNPQKIEQSPVSWYQKSTLYGQCIDMLYLINALMTNPTILESVRRRVQPQLLNGEKLNSDMRKVINKFETMQSIFGRQSRQAHTPMPPHLNHCLSDREVAAYARYALQLAVCVSGQGRALVEDLFMLLDLVINRLLMVIIEEPECVWKAELVEAMSLNVWKLVRVLQTKNNHRLFSMFLHKYISFLLHYYHTSIASPEYLRQYLISVRLVLGCKQYLSQEQFRHLLNVDKLSDMLVRLMQNVAEKPNYYTVLLYCLNFYSELGVPKEVQQDQLKSLYTIVDDTINPVHLGTKTRKFSKSETRQISAINKDVDIISVVMFFKLHLDPLTLKQSDNSLYSLIINSDTVSQTQGFNYKSLLFNIQTRPNPSTILKALALAHHATHHLEYISIFGHIYGALVAREGYNVYEDTERMEQLLLFVERVLDVQARISNDRHDDGWRNYAYMKCWALTILYIILEGNQRYSNIEIITVRVAEMVMSKPALLSLLGELLSYFGKCPVQWSKPNSRVMPRPVLGLLEKQLLHCLLKVYTSLISKSEYWVKPAQKTKNKDNTKNSFTHFCRQIVESLGVIDRKPLQLVSSSSQKNQVGFVTANNTPTAEFESTLQKMPVDYLYKNAAGRQGEVADLDTSRLKALHPECQNLLDVIHDHFNQLIMEKYLMMVLGCFNNPDLIMDSYHFQEIISVMEAVSKRIVDLSAAETPFDSAMNKLTTELWSSHRMNITLYYLNRIEESPKVSLSILNNIAELSINCIIALKATMELHHEYREFFAKADRVLKQARRNHSAYGFDVKAYVEQAGFEGRSQYGASFVASPSTYRFTR